MTTSDLSIAWATDTEAILADVLTATVGTETVDPDSHFFDDLGADSMLMARFCARLRKRAGAPSVSMKDIYANPTIRSLAAALTEPGPASEAPTIETGPPADAVAPTGTGRYVLCGAVQLSLFLAFTYIGALVADAGYGWMAAGSGWAESYLRTVLFGAVIFAGWVLLPILAKWVLVGRSTPERIPLWSLAYVRFWVVKTLIRMNPMALFVGTPLYVLYLRALGARIGRDVAILSRAVPGCPDLLTVGDGTVIRKDSVFHCYRAETGFIRTGPVTLGRDVVVSEATVLDVDTALADGAQLGHASALHAGQTVPAGERWHGSPAVRGEADYRATGGAVPSPRRKVLYSLGRLLALLALEVPLAVGGLAVVRSLFPEIDVFFESTDALTRPWFYAEVLAASFVLFFGAALVGLVVVTAVPRLLHRALEADRDYPLYSVPYGVHRTISRLTNNPFFLMVFGDSSYVVTYLRAVGYRLLPVEQTGSNFGTAVKHEDPFLTSIGTGTMVADGLSAMNAEYSNTSFRLSRVSVGPRSFLGNTIAYPAQAKIGDNCLLATKVMVPVDGEIRENVGLLGSPCFEIPRSVQRDSRFDHMATGEDFERRLAQKNRYNLRTMGVYLSIRWLQFFFVVLIALIGSEYYGRFGANSLAAASLGILLFNQVSSLLIEQASTRFRPLQPLFCSIYEPSFWFYERYWKLRSNPRVSGFLNGTPFKGLWWKLAGVNVGRRLFDDGCDMLERTLVTIGDDCVLNAGSEIQCHSQEDGTFKTDRSALGNGCTLGVGALVHYGVTVNDGAVVEADSFVMKGEEVPAGARWGGNPAREVAR